MAEYKVSHSPNVLITYGLGSCIGVIVYDNYKRIGGLLHFMLPYATGYDYEDAPARFADTGMKLMMQEMYSLGALHENLVAKIAGGAHMFSSVSNSYVQNINIGIRNAQAIRKILATLEIPIISEDIGGEVSRTVLFDLSSGVYTIKTLNNVEKQI